MAYPIQYGLTDVDESGEYSGYTYEYLEEIAQYTGWDYEFVQVPGDLNEQLSTLMEMVENGEVDLMGAMLYSEAMGEMYDYAGYSYGTAETVLQVLRGTGSTLVVDSQKNQTMRVAVGSTTGRMARELQEYCDMNLIYLEMVVYGSVEDQLAALKDGRVDPLLNTSMNYIEGVRTVASFAPKPFYFVTTKNTDNGLVPQLNEAIGEIAQADPLFQSKLYDKYFNQADDTLILSDKEKEYIGTVGELKVGVLPDQPPFQYKNAKTGELQGIGPDLLRYIAKETGLQLTLVEVESQDKLYEMTRNGEIDVIASMPYQYKSARQQQLSMTRPFLSSPYTILMHENMSEDGIQGKRLALSKFSTYEGYFVGQAVSFDTMDACVRAVNSGQADYTYVDTYTAQYYLNLPGFENLKMIPQTYTPRQICFGVANQEDNRLLTILNKAVLTLPAEDLQATIFSNTFQKQTFSIGYFIRKNPVEAVAILGTVFVIFIALLMVILIQRVKANRSMELELQKHMRLYAIANDYFFEYDYKKNHILFSVPASASSSEAKIQRLDFNQTIKDPDKFQQKEIFLKLIRSKDDKVQEVQMRSEKGNLHWLRITMETILDSADAPAYVIGKINVIDHEKMEKDRLRHKAQQDSLTHIYNAETSRNLVIKQLSQLQEDEHGVLVLLDIDCFKSINDTYGHLKGDEMLQAVADLLKRHFPKAPVIGRPGGDEFIIYLDPPETKESVEQKCRAFCEDIRSIEIGPGRTLTVSMGAALSAYGVSYPDLYQAADQAMYQAKKEGRDRFVIDSGFLEKADVQS